MLEAVAAVNMVVRAFVKMDILMKVGGDDSSDSASSGAGVGENGFWRRMMMVLKVVVLGKVLKMLLMLAVEGTINANECISISVSGTSSGGGRSSVSSTISHQPVLNFQIYLHWPYSRPSEKFGAGSVERKNTVKGLKDSVGQADSVTVGSRLSDLSLVLKCSCTTNVCAYSGVVYMCISACCGACDGRISTSGS